MKLMGFEGQGGLQPVQGACSVAAWQEAVDRYGHRGVRLRNAALDGLEALAGPPVAAVAREAQPRRRSPKMDWTSWHGSLSVADRRV